MAHMILENQRRQQEKADSFRLRILDRDISQVTRAIKTCTNSKKLLKLDDIRYQYILDKEAILESQRKKKFPR